MSQPSGKFLLYESEVGRTRIECRFANERLFQTDLSTHRIKLGM